MPCPPCPKRYEKPTIYNQHGRGWTTWGMRPFTCYNTRWSWASTSTRSHILISIPTPTTTPLLSHKHEPQLRRPFNLQAHPIPHQSLRHIPGGSPMRAASSLLLDAAPPPLLPRLPRRLRRALFEHPSAHHAQQRTARASLQAAPRRLPALPVAAARCQGQGRCGAAAGPGGGGPHGAAEAGSRGRADEGRRAGCQARGDAGQRGDE